MEHYQHYQHYRRFFLRTHVIAYPKRLFAPMHGVALALLTLLVAGCGTTSVSLGGTPAATAAPTLTPTRHVGGGLTVRPCPGPYGSAMPPSESVVILTGTTPGHTASAHVGQTVEVQLTSNYRWQYDATSHAAPSLTLNQPAGIEDGQRDLCIWNFTAQSPGTTTLTFTGSPLCEPNVPCPAIILAMRLTVNVS